MVELTFEFEEFEIVEEATGGYTMWKSFLCEVDLVMTEPSQASVMPSLNDPGEPGLSAEFEISEVRLTDVPDGKMISDATIILTLTETTFITFFAGSQDVVNNAYEWAAEQEIEYDGDY